MSQALSCGVWISFVHGKYITWQSNLCTEFILLCENRTGCTELSQINAYIWRFPSIFGQHHIIETLLITVTDDLLIAPVNGLYSVLVLLNLCTALDIINHIILLQRLEQLVGMNNTAFQCFKSYLSIRFHLINIYHVSSTGPVIVFNTIPLWIQFKSTFTLSCWMTSVFTTRLMTFSYTCLLSHWVSWSTGFLADTKS